MCDCLDKVDTALEKAHGNIVSVMRTMYVDPTTPHRAHIALDVQPDTARNRRKAGVLLANYCPFCGASYDAPTQEGATP